jgi:hypothetical protein
MEEFLTQLMGKRIDVSCGSALVRGDVVAVKDGVLYLRDENEQVAYVAIGKVAIVWEVKDNEKRTGFVIGKRSENS